jgi:hypothetical protein
LNAFWSQLAVWWSHTRHTIFTPVVLALWATVRHGTIVAAITDDIISIVSITLLVVIASRLYQRFGNRVNQLVVA